MNAIVGFASLLKKQGKNREAQNELIGHITRNSEALLQLINNIIELAKVQTNQVEIHFEYFNVSDLLQNIYTSWLDKKKNTNLQIRLNNRLPDKTFSMQSDKHKVEDILTHLMSNAYKFTRQGFIELGCHLQEHYAVFTVKDTGIGIAPENLEIIFEQLRKIEEDNQQLYRGAGLGLAISKKLTHLLQGYLWVESELNKGTTFYLSLPITTKRTLQ